MVWLCFIHINYRHNAYIIIYYALCCLDNNMTMATDCTRDMHQDGLILPRKPVNPCLTSNEHQNLHRELLFNQKMYDFFFSIPYKKNNYYWIFNFRNNVYTYIFFSIFSIFFYSGKNVLGQKSELQKALEKHKRSQTQKEIEQQKNSCRTPFERMIEERAKKIETVLRFIF